MNFIYDEPFVLVTGAFDIVHVGHIRLLEYARQFTTSKLIVMIDTDERIRETKGHGRPFNCFQDREEFLLSLKNVDYVMSISNDDDIVQSCKQYRPIRIVGGDWKDKLIVGKEWCKEIKYFNRIKDYSTTRILNDRK